MDLDSRPPQPLSGNDQGVTDEHGVLHAWDETFDAVVVGFGGAGSAAAIEAHDNGAKVLLVDRFRGGGSTKLSGGIFYAGGGTELQEKAGYNDDPENMFRYVKQEADGVVSDEVLRAFCEQSRDNFEWLKGHGIPFVASGKAYKTSYPPDDCTLYFSGNEICWPYNEKAEPAPRGHRPLGHGLTGSVIFQGLKDAVRKRGIDVWPFSRGERLVVDADGNVIGLRIQRARFRG
ncbi:MAG: FAD-dependent oxidoreductase, partial [Candidatus Dadabacteria bacterium]